MRDSVRRGAGAFPSGCGAEPGKPPLWTRRRFVGAVAGTLAAGSAIDAFAAEKAPASSSSKRKRVALLATEVRKYSHAQHFIDRLLEGYGWEGRHHYPPLELAGLYVDQFPAGDLSRERAERHRVKLFPSVAEALTLGTSNLAVDGVLIIGEHGTYPRNAKGQTLYPRYKFFKEVMQVFEKSGRAAPVFNDKHLSTDWRECLEMVADSKRLGFPFLAGSSLPVTWRIPSIDLPTGTGLRESVCVGYGGVDSYDFHGLETAQCMSERRRGGESGVVAVHALKGAAVWDKLSEQKVTWRLAESALLRSSTCVATPGYTWMPPSLDWISRQCPEPVAYFIEHVDGLRTSLLLLNGVVQDFTYAGLNNATGQILSCQMYLPMPPARASLANFFSPLMHHIETMVMSGQAPYPIERTLLTSGLTLFAVESLYRGQVRLLTPELKVAYSAPQEPAFWRT